MTLFKLGQRVRQIRDEKKISQSDLARMTGIAAPTISRLEHGKIGSLRAEYLIKLSRALNVTVDYLVGKTDSMRSEDYVVADKDAISIFQDFGQLDEGKKKLLKTFAEFLQGGGETKVTVSRGKAPNNIDDQIDLEKIIWRILSVERTMPDEPGRVYVKYTCEMILVKVKSTFYSKTDRGKSLPLDALNVESLRASGYGNTEIVDDVTCVGSASRPNQWFLDESAILAEAIESAKKEGLERLQKS